MSEPLHRISYKRYLTDAEEEIPPRTIRRWALKNGVWIKFLPLLGRLTPTKTPLKFSSISRSGGCTFVSNAYGANKLVTNNS